MISIDNSRNIENKKQENELNNELNMLKLKTAILKKDLSIYFPNKKSLTEPNKCIKSRDNSQELLNRLNTYEQFLDANIKILLNEKDIFEILKEIISTISVVRAEEIFKKESHNNKIIISASVDQCLISHLNELEKYLEKTR